MKTNYCHSRKEGATLGVVLIVMLALTSLVAALFHLSRFSTQEALYEKKSAQAFWLAEAGVQWCFVNGGQSITNSFPDVGSFSVVPADGSGTNFIATGTVTMGDETLTKSIQIGLMFLIKELEDAIFGGNGSQEDWDLVLGGEKTDRYGNALAYDGPPPASSSRSIWGGNDVIVGNTDVNGGVRFYDESLTMAVPAPNTYGLNGDVEYSGLYGSGLYEETSGAVAGDMTPINDPGHYMPPDLSSMDYEHNHTWDVAAEFAAAEVDGGVVSGRLPIGHPLRDVVCKNRHPSGSDPTPGQDDYYFEPSSVSGAGSPSTAVTPLNLGEDQTYYVDGHVWFHNARTYGFEVDGQAVIVASRDIHISDNLAYKDSGRDSNADMLALVALGQLSTITGDYVSDGNIYFGDPKYGTLYTCDAFLFANNSFYYNTLADTGEQGEPESGFKVFGNFMAMNQVVIRRDWYTEPDTYLLDGEVREVEYRHGRWYDVETNQRINSSLVIRGRGDRAAQFVDEDGDGTWEWVDAEDYENGTTKLLSDMGVSASDIRHYAMKVGYDDRIRDLAKRLSGLPRGQGGILIGYSWREL